MKSRITLFGLIVLLANVSCTSHYYHISSPHHVPLFKQENEISGTFSSGMNVGLTEASAQLAYSITNHIGLMGGYALTFMDEIESSNSSRGQQWNLGAGYFTPTSLDNTIFEVYGGVERNNQQHTYFHVPLFFGNDYVYNGNSRLAYNKFFIRPAFGYSLSFLEIALSTNFSVLSFSSIENGISNPLLHQSQALEELRELKHLFLLEPAITARVGGKSVKFHAQVILPQQFVRTEAPLTSFHINFGLSFLISSAYRE